MARIHITVEGTVETDLTQFQHTTETLQYISHLKEAADSLGLVVSITEVTTNLPAIIPEVEANEEPQVEEYMSDIQRDVLKMVERFPGRSLPELLAKKKRKVAMPKEERKAYENTVLRMIKKGMIVRTDNPEKPRSRLLWPVQK